MPAKLVVGDYISSGAITWEVLAVKDCTALLLTKDIIMRMPYYIVKSDYSDEKRRFGYVDSYIRSWLNGRFVRSLPDEFSRRIVPTKIEGANPVEGFDYSKYGLEKEGTVEDRVFLLSKDEATVLFPNNSSRKAKFSFDYVRDAEPKEFSVTDKDDRTDARGCNSWWLRTSDANDSYIVSSDGSIRMSKPTLASSYLVENAQMRLERNMKKQMLFFGFSFEWRSTALMTLRDCNVGVRPALWLSCE